MTNIRILGCSAGACRDLRTTALLVNGDTLLDCGSGVGDLTLEEMGAVRQVFLTHAHLDHVLFLPLLADATLATRKGPLEVYALPGTIQALRQHLFNDVLWPDYTSQPDSAAPYIRLIQLCLGESVSVQTCRYTALPARHSITSSGYWLDAGSGSLAFSGDSGDCPEFWEAVNGISNLRYVMIETTMRNEEEAAAQHGGHTTPAQLAHSVARLQRPAEILVTHIEPDKRDGVKMQVRAALAGRAVHFVERGEVFRL